jgi:uncharacterized protein (TIGR00251 family)
MAIQLIERNGGVALAVKVVPGASRDKLAGEYAGGIKVTVSKAPEAGAANKAVIALLAQTLGIPTSQIEITRGHTNPRKEVLIRGMTADAIRTRLEGGFQ